MPDDQKDDLRVTITTFEAMLRGYERNRSRLLERRHEASDHVMVEIDERLAVNARATAAFSRAVKSLRAQFDLLDRDSKNGDGSPDR